MKAKASLYFGAILCLVVLGTVACTKAPNDAQITSDIQAKINADSGLQGKQLGVQAENGTVTLSGNVDNDAQREAAARYASSEAGVKQVVNNLTVGSAQPEQAAQAARPAAKKRRETRKPKDDNDNNDAASSNPPTQMADESSTPPPAPAAPAVTPVPAAAPAPPSPPPPPQKVTIPSGTALTVRLVDPIDSEKNQTGDGFHATLNGPLTLNGDVVVPAGSDVQGHLASVKSAGKFAGQSEVVLQLDSITSGGNTYNIQTDQYSKQGSSRGKNTAEKVGVGAGIGAILGGIIGGGKGAAIGAASGGGIGGGVQAATKGQQIKLPSETVLNFTLQAPVTVVATAQGPNSGRPKLNTN